MYSVMLGTRSPSGVPQRTIAHWERTGRLAGRKEILALAKALKVSVRSLLREGNKTGTGAPTRESSRVTSKADDVPRVRVANRAADRSKISGNRTCGARGQNCLMFLENVCQACAERFTLAFV